MKRFYFWAILSNIVFISILSVASSAQTLENKTDKRFERGLVACGDIEIVEFYKTSDDNYVELASFKEQAAEEATSKIEKLVSEASEVAVEFTYFGEAENQTASRYVLRFEDSKDKTNFYKVAKFINEHTQISKASTLELALEFEKWQVNHK